MVLSPACGTESSNHPKGYLEWPCDPDSTEDDAYESRYRASCVQECQTESLTRTDAVGLIGEGQPGGNEDDRETQEEACGDRGIPASRRCLFLGHQAIVRG